MLRYSATRAASDAPADARPAGSQPLRGFLLALRTGKARTVGDGHPDVQALRAPVEAFGIRPPENGVR